MDDDLALPIKDKYRESQPVRSKYFLKFLAEEQAMQTSSGFIFLRERKRERERDDLSDTESKTYVGLTTNPSM